MIYGPSPIQNPRTANDLNTKSQNTLNTLLSHAEKKLHDVEIHTYLFFHRHNVVSDTNKVIIKEFLQPVCR